MRSKEAKSKQNGKEQPEFERITRKVIFAGTAFVLREIVRYSECNEAMLRVALLEEIATRDEAIILAKLLSDTLTFASREIGSSFKPSQNNIKTTCKWISELSDGFQDELSEVKYSDGESYLIYLLRSVAAATKHSQAILSLREDINRAASQKHFMVDGKLGSATPMEVVSRTTGEEIAGYSIDRLVF